MTLSDRVRKVCATPNLWVALTGATHTFDIEFKV